MRELKDYFCTFKQENELFKIGFDASQKIYIKHDVLRYVILRSQALDFFRELGYDAFIDVVNKVNYDYMIISSIFKENVDFNDGPFLSYHEAESALIDKLIELEREARNGN